MDLAKSQAKTSSKKEESKQKDFERQKESFKNMADFSNAMEKISHGAKLSDLSSIEVLEVVKVVGNQGILELLQGGNEVLLNNTEVVFNTSSNKLPINEVDIRWPVFSPPSSLARNDALPNGVFDIEHLSSMGSFSEQGGA